MPRQTTTTSKYGALCSHIFSFMRAYDVTITVIDEVRNYRKIVVFIKKSLVAGMYSPHSPFWIRPWSSRFRLPRMTSNCTTFLFGKWRREKQVRCGAVLFFFYEEATETLQLLESGAILAPKLGGPLWGQDRLS